MWRSLSEVDQRLILQELPLRRKKVLKDLLGDVLKEQYSLS